MLKLVDVPYLVLDHRGWVGLALSQLELWLGPRESAWSEKGRQGRESRLFVMWPLVDLVRVRRNLLSLEIMDSHGLRLLLLRRRTDEVRELRGFVLLVILVDVFHGLLVLLVCLAFGIRITITVLLSFFDFFLFFRSRLVAGQVLKVKPRN